MPIFADIPSSIVALIGKGQYPHTMLTPDVVRIWLRKNLGPTKTCDPGIAMQLLEYISADEQMDQLYDLPLFLCRDRNLRFVSKITKSQKVDGFRTKVYIGTSEESSLFDPKGGLFLQIEEYPQIVTSRIRTHISIISASLNLEIFNLHWFERYARDVLFSHPTLSNSNVDTIPMSICKIDLGWIQKLWDWLDTQIVKDVERVVQSLWLIPLENGKGLRKVSIF
jgi:hypothetical protein